ncbi:DUF5339 family protein [Neisseria sp. 23W00296]|uniref:DUF5339 family protein n=1 Tax=unclassified Neisseria TaxID=2623750 RepID=UPI0002A2F94F|nr:MULTISPECIES: DUF5339 family protein [unclassified Neisseria]ASP17797.1 hypothetical protein CGZ77_08610 [Neisseria sp. KEM232]EKY06199.1 hypothetical protein HMPREF9120_01548 [Neisseria sp. oral taxon 020 str. F0370]
MKATSLPALLITAFALAACGGNSSDNAASGAAPAAEGGSACAQYEKAFNDMLQGLPEAQREDAKKTFATGMEAMKNLPADQQEAYCQESLKGLKGEAVQTEEDKAEAASEAAEDAKEAAADAKEAADDAKEAASEAKEAAQ